MKIIVNKIRKEFMLNKIKKVMLPLILFAFLLSSFNLDARPREDKYSADNLMRAAYGIYDLQKNTVSNIEFYTTNYGIFGLNVGQNRGGGFWPRGSQNQYIFAGGIWLGAIKLRPGDTNYRKYVTITYNPNNGNSWMVPGRMNPDNTSEDPINQDEQTKYRAYFSTDFSSGDGSAIIPSDGEPWPIWDVSDEDTLRNNRYFGYYVEEIADRDLVQTPNGPAFISGEDIFATFKDTDLSRYDDGAGQRRNQGYPLRLQYEQMIYSWGFGDYKDFIFLKYEIANYSTDTLRECWMAPVMDIDIALAQNSQNGASNDRCRFYDEDETLNMALQWTEGTQGEQGQGFGYLGFDFLESPAVYESQWRKIQETVNGNVTTYDIRDYMALEEKDTTIMVDVGGGVFEPKDTVVVIRDTLVKYQIMVITDNGGVLDTNLTVETDFTGYLRKDKRFYKNKEQLGLQTFRNWPIAEDKSGDDERYNYMASRARDGDDGAGDKRFLMATGPFHMLPKDTVRVVVGLLCAKPAVRDEADGSTEDLETLVALDKFAQTVYDDNFRAPSPPDQARFMKWTPLDNAIEVEWDITSEMSNDEYEDGLDFLGYRLYRARRVDLDTFNIYNIGPTNEHTKGEGPFGWKQVAQWELPLPFQSSYLMAGNEINENPDFPNLDSIRIVGPYVNNDGTIDSNSIRIMRIGQGVRLFPDSAVKVGSPNAVLPIIAFIDTAFFSQPWGPYYSTLVQESEYPLSFNPFNPTDPRNNNRYLQEVAVGRLKLDPALVKFNPLLSRVQTINVNPLDTPLIPDRVGDTIYLKNTYREATIDGQKSLLIDVAVPVPFAQTMRDTIHIQNALRTCYAYIKQGAAEAQFPDFESSNEAKTQVIIPYMDRITNGRTFLDIGDDNRDGTVLQNADPTKTEKLLNSVDYYYRLISYDQGDYNQPTPLKNNGAGEGLPNQVETHPAAAPAGDYSQFEVTYVDTNKIGGLYNFQFYAVNPDRVNQLFGGHEFELEFNPWWNLTTIELSSTNPFNFGLYYRDVKLTDITTGDVLFEGRTVFEATPCRWSYYGGFTENAVSWYLSDTVIVDPIYPDKQDDFGTPYSQGVKNRSGYFTTGDFTQAGYCYSFPFQAPAENVFGFSFDYSIYQYGGRYRPDTVRIVDPNINTGVFALQSDESTYGLKVITTSVDGFNTVIQDWFGGRGSNTYGSLNNGPGDYLVKFKAGGTEEMELEFNKGSNTNRFIVTYLEYDVSNTMSHYRPDVNLDSVEFNYSTPFEPVEILDTLNSNGLPDFLAHYGQRTEEYYHKFNSSSIAFVNARYNNSLLKLAQQRAYPTSAVNVPSFTYVCGKQNRYYLSAVSVDGQDTVDFVNVLNIAGTYFAFDGADKGRFNSSAAVQWIPKDDGIYGPDFKAGDEVVLPVRGGAFGLPAPGAKVRVKVSASVPADGNYTEDMMNQIKAVPNPYYLSHQMQKSPYDSKLFFTKLPPVCTISIYTVNGDLIREIQHDESTSTDPYNHAVDVWDLLSGNSQRVQSQTMVAIIKSANGTEAVVPFSVVVGGFRLIQDN